MPPPERPSERPWRGLFAPYLLLLIVVGLVATGAFAGVDPADRPLVLRLAVAALVTVVVVHLHGHFRRPPDEAQPSAFDEARAGPPVEAKVAPVVTRLQEQVEYSVASQRYFNVVLWPRLERLRSDIPARFHALRERRWRRRGPSLAEIAELVRHIGDRK